MPRFLILAVLGLVVAAGCGDDRPDTEPDRTSADEGIPGYDPTTVSSLDVPDDTFVTAFNQAAPERGDDMEPMAADARCCVDSVHRVPLDPPSIQVLRTAAGGGLLHAVAIVIPPPPGDVGPPTSVVRGTIAAVLSAVGVPADELESLADDLVDRIGCCPLPDEVRPRSERVEAAGFVFQVGTAPRQARIDILRPAT